MAIVETRTGKVEGVSRAGHAAFYGIPFAALRTISDRADDSAHVDFTRFIARVASPISAAVLEAYFSSLSNM